jgi:eukaryotic-like serine/threonine-protein kinase
MAITCSNCGALNPESATGCQLCGKALAHRMTQPESGLAERLRRATIPANQPETEPETELSAGKEIGSYIVERRLAIGEMSTVYLARHRELDRLVALKMLHPTLTTDDGFRQRFLHEGRIQSQLSHPNIAQLRDFIEQDGRYFLVVEYLSGGTLADKLTGHRSGFEPGTAVNLATQALAGLAYAHSRGIVHRNIKTANLMLDGAGRVKVTNFGIALATGNKRLTTTGVIGTYHYMSPEQIRTPAEVDLRADVYAMGIVLFELLTGRLPFDSSSAFEVMRAQVQDAPPAPREVRAGVDIRLDAIVLKALKKKPEDRYQSSADFNAALAVATPLP